MRTNQLRTATKHLLLGAALLLPFSGCAMLQLVGAAIVLAGIILAQTSRPDRVIEADLALVTDTSRP